MKKAFNSIYAPDVLYRLTGVVLAGLISRGSIQYSLFDDIMQIERITRIYSTIDVLSERFGKHTVRHASSLPAKLRARHKGMRGNIPGRVTDLFKGENRRQRLGLPVLGIKV